MHLLLVEDDLELARQTQYWLKEAGHTSLWHSEGKSALQAVDQETFDAVILDVGLPDMDGFSIVKEWRAGGFLLPVLFLTARDNITDRVHGLKAGGDDYLTKPFASEELLARLEALDRRSRMPATVSQKMLGDWTLDSIKRRISKEKESIEFQPREWTLFEMMIANQGRVLTKKFLLEKVWDIHFDPGTNVVDAMVCRLRRKIEIQASVASIKTVRGKGYVLQTLS